jgi:hypothetical protein
MSLHIIKIYPINKIKQLNTDLIVTGKTSLKYISGPDINSICYYDQYYTFSGLSDITLFTYGSNNNTLICQQTGTYNFTVKGGGTLYINGIAPNVNYDLETKSYSCEWYLTKNNNVQLLNSTVFTGTCPPKFLGTINIELVSDI